jgi:hypothetical protein
MIRFVFAIALGATMAASASAQRGRAPSTACLHGTSEKADQRARRLAALEFVKRVNFIEGEGKLQAQQYFMLQDLPQLPPVPAGFKAQLSNDGGTYMLSLKDTLDPCRFAYVTDQDGVVYAAQPVADTVTK